MRLSKFWIFLLILLGGSLLLPEDILDIDSINKDTSISNEKDLISSEDDFISNEDTLIANEVDSSSLRIGPEYKDEEEYDLIYNAFMNLDDEIKLSSEMESDEVFKIREQVIEDHPEIFYLDYENSKYWSDGVLEFKYIDSKENIIEKRNKIEIKSNYIINKIIEPDMSEFEKELAIHDFLLLNTKYDVENHENGIIPTSSYNVDGVLLKGIGVCEGYAQTFKMLLEKVGIESIIVTEPRINHAWNIVKIDGQNFHVDLTWNDPVPDREGRALHTYFNVSDRKMLQGKHIWDQEKYPSCTSEKYSYMWRR